MFQVDCTLRYTLTEASTFIMNVAAAHTAEQRVETDSLSVEPACEVDTHVTPQLGNRYQRFIAPRGDLSVRYTARVHTAYAIVEPETLRPTPPHKLPLETVPYIVPSRYCQSDQLMRLTFREFARYTPGFPQVHAICDWIHANVDYVAGASGPMTTALDTVTQRAGVCRDFAHLGVAFCRALNIPARFVSGYAFDLNPPDFHAVFEAWLDGDWYLFDPTRRVTRAGFVRIGTGRDAADVPFALIIGSSNMREIRVQCWHAPDTKDEPPPHPTEKAVTPVPP